MSGSLHEPAPEPELDEEDQEYEDFIEQWFLTSGPDEALVLHDRDCASHGSYTLCTCVPVTLQRGAVA